MKRAFIFVFTVCILLTACSERAKTPKIRAEKSLTSKPLPPIRLTSDSSTVHLNDFINASCADLSVTFEKQELVVDSTCQCVQINSAPIDILGVLQIVCGGEKIEIPVIKSRKSTVPFSTPAKPDEKEAFLAGSFNGWNHSATPLRKVKNQWVTSLSLDPGTHSYQLVIDGEWRLDPANPNTLDNNMGGVNSVLTVGNPDRIPPCISTSAPDSGKVALLVETTSAIGEGQKADSTLMLSVWWENRRIHHASARQGETIHIDIPREARNMNRSHLRAWIADDEFIGEDVLLPLHFGEVIENAALINRTDLQSWNMYFVLIDRFADGDSSNNHPVKDPEILPIANHFGGDLSGLLNIAESGYFDQLGINAIWVSPITENAEGAWGLWDKGVRSKFSGYHGYWPVSSTKLNPHFGDSSDFATLIDKLHQRDMSMVVDYVANHVHELHPVYQKHPDWATELHLPDGSLNTERWDEHRLTTWFDTFLPTLDLGREDVAEAMTDSALYWVQSFDIDGFRHDATKHIPDLFWRKLTSKIKTATADDTTGRSVFQIGETYGNPELIGSYIGAGLLDAQFDFNLYDAAVDAFAKPESDFSQLERVLNESLSYYGYHHLMGNISGNQDRARFISYADGSVQFDEDAKLAGWTRDITHKNKRGFARMALLHAFNLTAPGIPCLYYGDEIGMPGGNDPDNRRMMRFDKLTDEEIKLRKTFGSLAKLRQSRMSLMYGQTRMKFNEGGQFAYERSYLGERTLVVFSKGEGQVNLDHNYQYRILESASARLLDGAIHFNDDGFAVLDIVEQESP